MVGLSLFSLTEIFSVVSFAQVVSVSHASLFILLLRSCNFLYLKQILLLENVCMIACIIQVYLCVLVKTGT